MITAEILIRDYQMEGDMIKVVVYEQESGISTWATSKDREVAEKLAIERFRTESWPLIREKMTTITFEN